jgi:hypothetical protein
MKFLALLSDNINLKKQGERIIFETKTKKVSLLLNNIYGILVFGRIHISGDALNFILKKDIPVFFLTRFGRKQFWVKQNPDFSPQRNGCPNDFRGLLISIDFHLRDIFVRELYLYAHLAMAFGSILAANLDLALPPLNYLPLVFASPIYALTGTMWLRQENLELNPYSAIPPRGAVYVFYNEILNNDIFANYLFRSLSLLED